MPHHMALHNDVLGRIHTILKQDDYFRTLKELPVIDGLHTYDDIQLFPDVFDTAAVIERVTSEADLIEKQLNRSGMYLLTQTPLPCTSGFIPRPSSMFQPITPTAPSPTTGGVVAKPVHKQQSKETSPGSSLPCGQGTPTAPTNSQIPAHQGNNTTPQGTLLTNLQAHMQPQNAVPQQQSPLPHHNFQTLMLSQHSHSLLTLI